MGVLRKQLQRLLAAPFIVDSVETLRDPEPRAEALAPMVSRLSKRYAWVPDNPVLVVRVQAAAGVGAGTLLLLGKGTRLACVVMAAQAVPSIVAAAQGQAVPSAREGAIKDLGLLGALVLVATEPRRRPPKVVYDAQHAVHHARRSTARARKRAGRAARRVSTRIDPRSS
ncbi:DoxX family membrane protein [Streptomonospora sp. S1-112]|uniref:DoxX family membrane protein n=1 Tax=Streptomonospora mangrovi TaxID=2883123 RepID=A0A9X3SG60_9ACTN|nr:DoxX family membrane protein [Streptomonospora mangrovi]MDA0566532.1 DoxX family membrane protein [Streptomonospora mangrovi]